MIHVVMKIMKIPRKPTCPLLTGRDWPSRDIGLWPLYTPSQGCSSGSGHYTPSVKAALQRAEILVVDTKLGRDPITDLG